MILLMRGGKPKGIDFFRKNAKRNCATHMIDVISIEWKDMASNYYWPSYIDLPCKIDSQPETD